MNKHPKNVTHKLINDHLIEGEMTPGEEIGLKIDHVLQQDATGTLVMLELEALGLDRTKAEIAVQYVDHNLLQTDYKNADDHLFLQSAARKFGYHFSRSGNGISHAVHQEVFGKPGKTLLGSDSHTCAGGGIGMLAIGTGGMDVALAAAGEPYYVKMPKVLGVELTGELPPWTSAKDIVLEMLKRYDVKGGVGYILEYYGPGVKSLTAWDRHVIANMGTEMGATSTVFPSDENTLAFLKQQGREDDYVELSADSDSEYDDIEKLDLNNIEPMIACPSSPGNVVRVREVEGKEVAQVVIGSSANPGMRDYGIVANIMKGKTIHEEIDFDINPSSRQVFRHLTKISKMASLIEAGGRIHQTGCMGCIGMGQAPPTGSRSLRTMPRNFPGRSGTEDDQVFLCSPETAAATALTGKITDPRDLADIYDMDYPQWKEPEPGEMKTDVHLISKPLSDEEARKVKLKKGPNIRELPEFDSLKDVIKGPVLLKMDDNISTDEILKAGSEVLPFRSNIEELSKFAYTVIDDTFYDRAKENNGPHVVVGGENYAQGSSREHAALCPRYLGQEATIAKSYARIGWQNLINFGIVPFEFVNSDDYDRISQGDLIQINNVHKAIDSDETTKAIINNDMEIELRCTASKRQVEVLKQGGLINKMRKDLGSK